MKDELQRKVEAVKQDADVLRALKRASLAEKVRGPVARVRDKLLIGTHLVLLIALAAFYQLLRIRFDGVLVNYPIVQKLIVAFAVVLVCLIILKLSDVYFVGRVEDAVYQYTLKRVSRLVIWVIVAFLVLTIFFQNWYTAVVSLGLLSLILGFALQTPITSFIGWVYILVREPYRVASTK